MTKMNVRAAMIVAVAGLMCTATVATAQETKPGAATPPPVPGGQAVSLKPMFKTGQEFAFTQRFVRSDTMSLASMGDRTTTMDQTNGWVGKVINADEKGATVELQFKSIKAELKETVKQGDKPADEVTTSWDSTKPADDKEGGNPIVGAFRPVLDMKLELSLDANGAITNVKPSEAAPTGMTRYTPFVRQTIDPDLLRIRLQPMFSMKTTDAKAFAGQDWSEDTVMSAPPLGKEKVTTTRTLSKMDGDVAVIAIKGKSELLPIKEGEKPQGEIIESDVSGTCLWDLKAGMCKHLEWKQKSTMSVNAQGFAVQRKSDWTMTVTPK